MDYFTADKVGRSVVLRLDQGDLVLESIEKVLEETGIQQGVVISGIGTLDQSVLHMVTTTGYPAVEYFDKKVDQPLEVVSIHRITSGIQTCCPAHDDFRQKRCARRPSGTWMPDAVPV